MQFSRLPSTRLPSSGVAASARAGFTLVEIMVVIVILGLLATIVGNSVLGTSVKAELKTAEMNVGRIQETVEVYMLQNHHRIPTWPDLLERDANGHRYMDVEDPPTDPWGNEYEITSDPEYESHAMVFSYGPDGSPNTEDDITNRSITENKEH